jgi:surface antigen
MISAKLKTKCVVCIALALCAGLFIAPRSPFIQSAQADTYGDLVNAQHDKTESVQRESQLRAQLAGVKSELADKIVALDELTNSKIPAAQSKASAAVQEADQAQKEADATADRLAAAQKDKESLDQLIKKTGEDYDDSRAAVASLARESMHGSDMSDIMSVVIGSSTSAEFTYSMQSRDVLSRVEANAASSDANVLNSSMNRKKRLAIIEQRIAKLKVEVDEKAASAQKLASQAQSEWGALDALRAQGESQRNDLESEQGQLSGSAAKQATQTVLLQSNIDDYNRQYAQQQIDASNQVNSGQQSGTTTPSQPENTPHEPAAPSVPSTGGQGTSNGDFGNRYVAGQCTWYAYNRRAEMGIGTPSLLGNGGEWFWKAPQYGLRVDHSPQVGAALSFLPGQDGADGSFGHVAVVEAVYGNGTFLISEMNWGGAYITHSRVLTNQGQYWFVH